MATSRLEQLLKFHEQDPDDPFIAFALASEYLKAGDDDTALGWFERLANSNPEYIGTYYHLGKLYERLGLDEDALRTYESGIRAASEANDLHAVSELRSAKMELEIG